MAGYEDTRQKIISTLMGRPNGTEIQPENHQDYALNMLDYIRSLELIATSTLIGIAESNTTPVQPNDSRVCYIAGVAQNQTVTFENFIAQNGNPISITTGDMEGVFVILMWNTQYWSAQTFSTNIISQSESATFYYRYNIRKTYASIALMNADVASPIGTDGKYIKVGDIVTVVNSTTPSENGIYSYEGTTDGWKFQSSFNFQVEQIRSQNTNTAPSSKLLDDELVQVRSDLNELEIIVEQVKDGGLEDGSIELPKLSPTLLSYIGSGGAVTNQADDEDLENTVINGVPVIREKTTKTYTPETYSGMGRVIIRKNMVNGVNVLTQEMINQANTIYEIRYDFDLNGMEIAIPSESVLLFEGGSFSNGTVIGNNTKINAGLQKIFGLDIIINGTWILYGLYPEWFGAKGDYQTDDILPIQKCFDIGINIRVDTILSANYVISTSIKFNQNLNIHSFYTLKGINLPKLKSSSNSPIFSTSLTYTKNPVAQYLKVTGIQFQGSPNNYVLDGNKIMRVEISDCVFNIKLLYATVYVQTLYVHNCKISNYGSSESSTYWFQVEDGLHDVKFDNLQFEYSIGGAIAAYGGSTFGIVNLSVTNCLFEALRNGAAISYRKVESMYVAGCYFEDNKGGHIVAIDSGNSGIALFGNTFNEIYSIDAIDNTNGSGTYKVVWFGTTNCSSISNNGLTSEGGNKGHYFITGTNSLFINDTGFAFNSLGYGASQSNGSIVQGLFEGKLFYNTTLKKWLTYNGTDWVSLDGTAIN